jgi:hypothetical protein
MFRPATTGRDALRIATIALTLGTPFADASFSPPGASSWPAILSIAIALLLGAMLMPALVHIGKVVLRVAWAFLKIAIGVVLHETVKWLLLASSASLGLLHYLE